MKHKTMAKRWEDFSQILSALEKVSADNKGPLRISPEAKMALLDLKQLKSYQNVSILGYGPSGPLDLTEGFSISGSFKSDKEQFNFTLVVLFLSFPELDSSLFEKCTFKQMLEDLKKHGIAFSTGFLKLIAVVKNFASKHNFVLLPYMIHDKKVDVGGFKTNFGLWELSVSFSD